MFKSNLTETNAMLLKLQYFINSKISKSLFVIFNSDLAYTFALWR